MKRKIWIAFLCGSLTFGSIGIETSIPRMVAAQGTGAAYIQNQQQSIQSLVAASKPAAKFVVSKKAKEYLKKGLLFGYGINFKMNKKQMIQKFGPITGSYEYEGTLYLFKRLGDLGVSFNGLQAEDRISGILMTPNQYGKINRAMVKQAWGEPESEGPSDEDANVYLMFYDLGNMRVYLYSSLHSNKVNAILIIAE